MQKVRLLVILTFIITGGLLVFWIYNQWEESSTTKKISLVKRLYLDLHEVSCSRGSFPVKLEELEEYPAFTATEKLTKVAFSDDLVSGSISYYPENGNAFLRKSSDDKWILMESDPDIILMSWVVSNGRIDCSVGGAVEFERRKEK